MLRLERAGRRRTMDCDRGLEVTQIRGVPV